MFLLGCPLTEFVFLEDVQAIFGQCRGGNRCFIMILTAKFWQKLKTEILQKLGFVPGEWNQVGSGGRAWGIWMQEEA